MELLDVFKKRRSHRHYIDKEVSLDLIRELIQASTFAPVSCNLQLTQYVVVNDKKINSDLTERVSYKFKYAPCNIIVMHDSRFSIDREAGVMSTGMAVENILLRAAEVGLAACSMAGFKKDAIIKDILGIPDYMDILLVISIGYADESFRMADISKIKVDDRFSLNKYAPLSTINDSFSLSKQSVKDIINYRKRIAPVYLDRFRLNTYNPKYYEKVYNCIFSSLFPKDISGDMLDLMSYDGFFLKTVHDGAMSSNLSITASDYIESNLVFIKENFGYDTVLISDKNSLVSKKVFDYITFVFQINFTPEVEVLIESVVKQLKPKGLFVMASINESWYKKVARVGRNLYLKYILRKKVNIYENNPFYKIGPFRNLSSKKVDRIYGKNNLKLVKNQSLKIGRATDINIRLYQKN